jgi:FkbM family methyltransferase
MSPTSLQIKLHAQRLLRRAGVYYRLQSSSLYYAYWKIADASVVEDEDKEVEFYRHFLIGLRPNDLVFDIGANHGAKTTIFLRLGSRVVALDPDEVNGGILEQKFLKYHLRSRPVTIIKKAVSDRATIETLWIEQPGSAKNTLSRKWVESLQGDENRFGYRLQFTSSKQVETTTLEKLVSVYGSPFFIKIDVEGYELSVLRGLRRRVPYLSFEVNLPEFARDGLECVKLLHALNCSGEFNYSVDCRKGFVLERWLAHNEFSRLLGQCTERSIEVFWRSLPLGDR